MANASMFSLKEGQVLWIEQMISPHKQGLRPEEVECQQKLPAPPEITQTISIPLVKLIKRQCVEEECVCVGLLSSYPGLSTEVWLITVC